MPKVILNLFSMNKKMTFRTNRNYIVAVFYVITVMMVIFRSLVIAFDTFQSTWMRNHSIFYPLTDTCRGNFLMSVFFVCLARGLQPFFASQIFFCDFSTFVRFVIFFHILPLVIFVALFTYGLPAMLSSFSPMKFKQSFNFFARRTFFCYGWFRHDFFLIKKLCFEPLEGQSLCGSFYYALCGREIK